MPTLTVRQTYDLARDAYLNHNQAVIAVAIAIAESGLRTDARGDVSLQDATWGPSIGLWQIRSLKAKAGTADARDGTRLHEPKFNSLAMTLISSRGTDWEPWSTYKNGAYRSHLQRVQREVGLGSGLSNPLPAPTPSGPGTQEPGEPLWPGSAGNVPLIDPGPNLGGNQGANAGLTSDLASSLFSGLVIAAGVGLGVTLVAIGAWRAVSS